VNAYELEAGMVLFAGKKNCIGRVTIKVLYKSPLPLPTHFSPTVRGRDTVHGSVRPSSKMFQFSGFIQA